MFSFIDFKIQKNYYSKKLHTVYLQQRESVHVEKSRPRASANSTQRVIFIDFLKIRGFSKLAHFEKSQLP